MQTRPQIIKIAGSYEYVILACNHIVKGMLYINKPPSDDGLLCSIPIDKVKDQISKDFLFDSNGNSGGGQRSHFLCTDEQQYAVIIKRWEQSISTWENAGTDKDPNYAQGLATAAQFIPMIFQILYEIPFMEADSGKSILVKSFSFGYINDEGKLCGFCLYYDEKNPSCWICSIFENANGLVDERKSTVFASQKINSQYIETEPEKCLLSEDMCSLENFPEDLAGAVGSTRCMGVLKNVITNGVVNIGVATSFLCLRDEAFVSFGKIEQAQKEIIPAKTSSVSKSASLSQPQKGYAPTSLLPLVTRKNFPVVQAFFKEKEKCTFSLEKKFPGDSEQEKIVRSCVNLADLYRKQAQQPENANNARSLINIATSLLALVNRVLEDFSNSTELVNQLKEFLEKKSNSNIAFKDDVENQGWLTKNKAHLVVSILFPLIWIAGGIAITIFSPNIAIFIGGGLGSAIGGPLGWLVGAALGAAIGVGIDLLWILVVFISRAFKTTPENKLPKSESFPIPATSESTRIITDELKTTAPLLDEDNQTLRDNAMIEDAKRELQTITRNVESIKASSSTVDLPASSIPISGKDSDAKKNIDENENTQQKKGVIAASVSDDDFTLKD
jgi:hypothetical protein